MPRNVYSFWTSETTSKLTERTCSRPPICFHLVLRRGSVTSRQPHRFWCVYDSEGTSKAIQQHLPHAKSQINALKIPPKLLTPQGGTKAREYTSSLHRHTMFIPKIRKKIAGQHNSRGLAAYVPSPSYLSPNSFSCCHSPSTVRDRLCCCDSSTRELLWHSEHKERGESRDSEPSYTHPSFLGAKKGS